MLAALPKGPDLRVAKTEDSEAGLARANPREHFRTILAELGKPLSRRQIGEASRLRTESIGAILQEHDSTGPDAGGRCPKRTGRFMITAYRLA